jgi:transposase
VPVFCGIDWAEDHHDVAIVDDAGLVLKTRRIQDSAHGYQELLELLAEHGDNQDDPIPVAIETSRGLLVACLRRTGRQVYAINPLAVARYRDRHSLTRAKSDRVDAKLLANILRTDRTAHRALPDDTELAQAIAVLARAQQDAVWNRQQVVTQLRSLVREYYPALMEAFQDHRPGGLAHPDARAVLALAPTPTQAARLTRPQLKAALRRAGRQRGITATAVRLQAIFRRTWLHQPPLVESAMGKQALALLKQLEAAAEAADDLAVATRAVFQQHPDAAILVSFPGLGELPAARLLAEIGDDTHRFADARGLKAYAGAAPVTRASGKKLVVLHRIVKNDRLAAVGYLWSFASLRLSPGARAHYDRRRILGNRHAAAQRHLFNRFLGCLHYCLHNRQLYSEELAFPSPKAIAA